MKAKQLALFFEQGGYVRWQNPDRVAADGPSYRKGDELRFVARSQKELRTIRRLLREAGFKPGRPFRKGNQYRQPVYGRQEVARLLGLMGKRSVVDAARGKKKKGRARKAKRSK